MTITLAIIILTGLLSFSAFSNEKLKDDLIFYPPAISRRKQYYRFITHGLIHADFLHLFFNMFALYTFGKVLEEQVFSYDCFFGRYGKLLFLLLYVGGLIVASIPDSIKHRDNYHYRSLGASGAVSAVIFAGITILPKLPIGFLIPGFELPGYIFGILYLGISVYLDRRGGGNINHGAHFWGALFGIAFTLIALGAFGKVNILENFLEQMKASQPFLPRCD